MKTPAMTKILPHKAPMLLLDSVTEYNETKQSLCATFSVNPSKLFYDKALGGMNSLVGIEIMAQTIGCYSYYRMGQKKPSTGLLLGSRLFNNAISCFKNGETYFSYVHEVFTDNQIAAFDCIIRDIDGEEIQSAGLTVYQIDNMEEFIKNENR